MRPRNNILAFIAAVVVSVQTFPLNIGRGSGFVYDPDSIPHNEKILRLFLQLASHTANRLIHLKNEAKLQKASNPDSETILPAVCRIIHDSHPRQGSRGKGHHERHVQPYAHGQRPSRVHINGKSKGPLSFFPKSNQTHSDSIDKVLVHHEELEKPKKPHNSDSSISDGSDNYQRAENETKVSDPSFNNSLGVEQVTGRPHNSHGSSTGPQDKLDNSTGDNGTGDSDDFPVEIASRALFNLEKNHYVTNYHDNSRNINNAETRINNIAGPKGIPQLAPVVINQNAGNSGFQGNKQGDNINQANTVINNSGSGASGSFLVAQNAGSSGFSESSQHSAGSIKKVASASSSAQSKSSESFQRTKSVSSNSQSVSSGLVNASQSLASGMQSAQNAASQIQSVSSGIMNSTQAQNAASQLSSMSSGIMNSTQAQNAASQLSSMSSGIMNSTQAQNAASQLQAVSSGIMNSTQAQNAASQLKSMSSGIMNSTQAQNAASQLQAVSSGIMNSANGVASKTESAGAGISTQAQNGASQLHSVSSGIMNSMQAQNAASQLHSVSSGIMNSTQAQNAASQLNSMSSGIMNSAGDITSKAGNAGIATQAQNVASQLQSVSSGIMNSANGVASTAKNAAAGSEMSREALREQGSSQHSIGNQHDKTSETHEKLGMLHQNKSGGVLEEAKKVTSILKQGTALANSNQAMSSIAHVGNGTMDEVVQTAQNSGSNALQGLAKPILDTPENVGNSLEDLSGAGSKITGSVVMETGSGSKTAFETSFRRGSASSSLMTSGSDGFTQVGSGLIGSIPLFRSFPDVYDQSSTVKTFSLDNHSTPNQTGPTDGPISTTSSSVDIQGLSTIQDKNVTVPNNSKRSNNTTAKPSSSISYDDYPDNEEISQLELEEYTNRFADALRPVEFSRGRDK